jgi:trimeric autotransporter adhesin
MRRLCAFLFTIAAVTNAHAITVVRFDVNWPTTLGSGGPSTIGRVQIDAGAPAGGYVVTLNDPAGMVDLPATVTIPAGINSAQFEIKPKVITANKSGQLEATDGTSVVRSNAVWVKTQTLTSFAFNPSIVTVGEQATTASLYIDGPAAVGGTTVTLTNPAPSQLDIPASVTFAEGQNQATFQAVAKAAPFGGSTLSVTATGVNSRSASISVYPVPVSSVVAAETSITGGASFSVTATLAAAAPPGGQEVRFKFLPDDGTLVLQYPVVTIAEGQTSGTATIATRTRFNERSANIAATTGRLDKAGTAITIHGYSIDSVTFGSAAATNGETLTGTVAINAPAPSGGMLLSARGLQGWTPQSVDVTIPEGQTTGTFSMVPGNIYSSGTANIVVSHYLGASKTVSIPTAVGGTVASLTASRTDVRGGDTIVLTASLAAPAARYLPVTCTYDVAKFSSVSGSNVLNIQAGASSGVLNLMVQAHDAPSSSSISCVADNPAQTVNINLLGATFDAVDVTTSPSAAVGGADVRVMPRFTGTSTSPLTLSSSNPTVLPLPATLYSYGLTVRSGRVMTPTPVTVTATWNNVTRTSEIVLSPLLVADVSLRMSGVTSLAAPTTTEITVRLDKNVPYERTETVTLQSSHPAVTLAEPVLTFLPSTGAKIVTVNIGDVETAGPVTITAATEAGSRTLTFEVRPSGVASISSLTFSAASVEAGAQVIGTVSLPSAATSPTAVSLISNYTSRATVPASVTVAQGQTSATFPVTALSEGTARITAVRSMSSLSADLTVTPAVPATLSALTLSATTVRAGASTSGTAVLTKAAPQSGVVVNLSAPSGVTVPSSITIPAGSSSGSFTIATAANAPYAAEIRAVSGAASASAMLQVTPVLYSLTSSQPTIANGQTITGTITLTGMTKTAISVLVASSDAGVVVPSTVTIPSGASSATFPISATKWAGAAFSVTAMIDRSQIKTLNLGPTR